MISNTLLASKGSGEHLGLLALQAAVALPRRKGADAHLRPTLPHTLNALQTGRVVDRQKPDGIVAAGCLSALILYSRSCQLTSRNTTAEDTRQLGALV